MTATTAEERLCSRGWRLLHSWWLIVPIISLGLLNFLPFLVNGIRARRRSWLVLSGIFFVAIVVYITVFSGIDTGTKANPKNSYVGGYLVANWAAGVAASIVTNRSRLRWRAAKDDRAWYASGATPPASRPMTAPTIDVDAVLRGGAGSAASEVAASTTASVGTVDLNTATSAELGSHLHVGPDVVARIEAARARLGGFRTADQLMTEAGLPPHVFAAVRDRISVSAPLSPTADPVRPSGSGRRLEF